MENLTVISSSYTKDNLTDVDTSDCAIRLAPSATHSSLQPIGTSTGQHLVDTDDVIWVGSDAHMKTFLSGDFDEISVCG